MTAWSSIESAVEAMRRGARDYIEKPWDNERLLATIRSQLELGRAVRKAKLLEAENELLRSDSRRAGDDRGVEGDAARASAHRESGSVRRRTC